MCMYVCMCMRVVWSGLVFSVNNIVHDFSLRGAETPCPLKLRKKTQNAVNKCVETPTQTNSDPGFTTCHI